MSRGTGVATENAMNRLGMISGILLTTAGCSVPLEQLSSGHVGCQPEEIRISDERRDPSGWRGWKATCGETVYIRLGRDSEQRAGGTHVELLRADDPRRRRDLEQDVLVRARVVRRQVLIRVAARAISSRRGTLSASDCA
jgi:hypothetical protein